jgi:hypothetical protein
MPVTRPARPPSGTRRLHDRARTSVVARPRTACGARTVGHSRGVAEENLYGQCRNGQIVIDPDSPFFRAAESGDLLPLAGLLVHEACHTRGGSDEAIAYRTQLAFLQRHGASDELLDHVMESPDHALSTTKPGENIMADKPFVPRLHANGGPAARVPTACAQPANNISRRRRVRARLTYQHRKSSNRARRSAECIVGQRVPNASATPMRTARTARRMEAHMVTIDALQAELSTLLDRRDIPGNWSARERDA